MKLCNLHLGYQYVILNYFSWIFQLTSKESQYLQNAVEEKSTTHPCAQRRVFSLLCVIDDSSFGPTSSSWLARRVVNLTNIYIYTHKTHTNKSQHSPCSSIRHFHPRAERMTSRSSTHIILFDDMRKISRWANSWYDHQAISINISISHNR